MADKFDISWADGEKQEFWVVGPLGVPWGRWRSGRSNLMACLEVTCGSCDLAGTPGPVPPVNRPIRTAAACGMMLGKIMEYQPCVLCGRVTKLGTTEHHLIPRTCHRRKWFKRRFSRSEMAQTIDVCRDCHRAIHQFIPDEKELGRDYNTPQRLTAHPEFRRFLDWVKKQK